MKTNPNDKTELTKREAFAMAAMQGLCARENMCMTNIYGNVANLNITQLVETSVIIADELIKELNRTAET